jgi:23S rRNA pseudouridine1911/1915/1917 synthase
MKIDVLYEDNHLIAVLKPAGVLVQGDHTGEDSLIEYTKDYIKEKYNKPGNVFLGLVHRLDRPVAGVVLFAKTSKGASRISEQFRLHTVEKIYHAIVEGKLSNPKGKLVHHMEKVGENAFVAKVTDKPGKNTSQVELEYEVVKSNETASLVRVRLITGKFHQIRSQFAHIGHPIIGDVKYGSKRVLPDQSILLRATSLTFTTATGEEKKTVSIDLPEFPC